MKNSLLSILLLFISFSSCDKDDVSNGVLMRIDNNTSQNFPDMVAGILKINRTGKFFCISSGRHPDSSSYFLFIWR